MTIIDLNQRRAEQSRTPWVRLTADLETEMVLEPVYLKGSEGRVIEIEPSGKHADCWPVLFDNYSDPLWVNTALLEVLPERES